MGPLKLFSKSLQQSSYAAAVVDRLHVLNQWFLTGVRPNLWGSVSQPQGFGRSPLKYKHSPRIQSEIGQPTAKRRTSVEVLLSFAAGESSFSLYSRVVDSVGVEALYCGVSGCGSCGLQASLTVFRFALQGIIYVIHCKATGASQCR